MLLGVFSSAIIVYFALYLHSTIFAWDLAMLLQRLGVYSLFLDNKALIICLFFGIIVIFTFLIIIIKFSNYLYRINTAVEQIFLEGTSYITLPDELIEIEDQLNSIRDNMEIKTKEAKESEQRKNDLIVYLAHDLKTPLASVIGYLNLLNDSPDLSPETKAEYVNISLDRALRLEELINELFDITKFNLHDIELNMANLNITLMLRQIIDEFYPILTEHDLSVTGIIESNIIIKGDGDKLARVFDNLLKNAINYGDSNTEICIQAKLTDIDGLSYANIDFINHGRPIPEDKLGLIFEKFYRVDSSRSSSTGGSGVGLAVAKEIVRAHHGTITAVSSEEHTIFSLSIPTDMSEI